jgi:hypothetical protein
VQCSGQLQTTVVTLLLGAKLADMSTARKFWSWPTEVLKLSTSRCQVDGHVDYKKILIMPNGGTQVVQEMNKEDTHTPHTHTHYLLTHWHTHTYSLSFVSHTPIH